MYDTVHFHSTLHPQPMTRIRVYCVLWNVVFKWNDYNSLFAIFEVTDNNTKEQGSEVEREESVK